MGDLGEKRSCHVGRKKEDENAPKRHGSSKLYKAEEKRNSGSSCLEKIFFGGENCREGRKDSQRGSPSLKNPTNRRFLKKLISKKEARRQFPAGRRRGDSQGMGKPAGKLGKRNFGIFPKRRETVLKSTTKSVRDSSQEGEESEDTRGDARWCAKIKQNRKGKPLEVSVLGTGEEGYAKRNQKTMASQ